MTNCSSLCWFFVDAVNFTTTTHYPDSGPPDISLISLCHRILESVFEFSHIGLTPLRRGFLRRCRCHTYPRFEEPYYILIWLCCVVH